MYYWNVIEGYLVLSLMDWHGAYEVYILDESGKLVTTLANGEELIQY